MLSRARSTKAAWRKESTPLGIDPARPSRVTLNFTSWNRMHGSLKQLEELRGAA